MHSVVDVDIVILNRNQGLLLERAIRSGLAQTFPGRFYEVLAVDAGSTDFSREVITSYGSRVRPVFLDPPASLGQALCKGVRQASGRYVVLMRAQDFLSDYAILFQSVWLFQNPEYDGVSVDFCLVEPGTDSKVSRVSELGSANPFGTMFRKEVFMKEGLYEKEDARWEPEALGIRLCEKYRIGHIPIPFYRYQQEASEKTNGAQIEPKGASER